MSRYVKRINAPVLPRLPLEGSIDLTYRCNNDCRHCWLRVSPASPAIRPELSFEEIRRIADEARRMGCRKWSISGGEPMIREDFPEIFEYLTKRSATYVLNTNGTLMTPAIARLMKRRGSKMLALYGATAEVHDRVTRRPGSFEDLRRGISLLNEAGAGFTVQVVPMKSNFHQFDAMVRLAESWSPSWRLGASWLYLSADGDPTRNADIVAERLSPAQIVGLDKPEIPKESCGARDASQGHRPGGEKYLFASCIAGRRDFHLDPYGGMSFCSLVKDPALRCDLRETSFAEAWDVEIPALAGRLVGGRRFLENCGSCASREDCRWCPVYAYLEHRDHSAKVEYLCGIAGETKKFKSDWSRSHRRFYRIAGITVQVDSDLPITDETFHPKFEPFQVEGPGEDMLFLHHHFTLPEMKDGELGTEVYRRPPWAIYRKNNSWIYVGIYPHPGDERITRIIVFNDDHSRARIFNATSDLFLRRGMDSLTLLSSDQILLARVLPRLGGAFIHSAGVSLNGRGLLFAGPSEAGKSTMIKMLKNRARVLCDDRMIVRKNGGGFLVHGTWSHGEIPEVAPDAAPFRALFFLHQSPENRLERIADPRVAVKELLARIVRPLVTADWWEDVLTLAGDIVREVPCYDLYFDKSGRIADLLEDMAQ